ncbi:S8 family serine peptidase [Flavobacterium sp.]|uniref:S8 family serine peptidase n=1 Tax=Flavobacterium sp. TaxID=239 RepID=UPI00260A9818|nr:S8 family serine peptidase [Flavobacterium sp.]
MKKYFTLLILLLYNVSFSQEDAWVYFLDKPNAQTFLNNPLSILSQRALDRRAAQGIALDVMDAPIHQPYIDQITTIPGITVMAKSKWLNALHVRGTQQAITNLTSQPFVSSVDFANKTLNITGRTAQNPTSGLFQKAFSVQADYPYGQSAIQIQMLNGHLLHQQNYTGSGKIIAVLDAGFPGVNTTAPFARIRNNNQIKGGYNFVNRNDNFYTGYQHGTQVLSNMAAYVENQLVGTAPDASYYLFVTEDYNTENPLEESLWVEAAEMADSLGVDVINSSLGYSQFTNASYNYTYQDMDGNTTFVTRGANIAFTRGMIVVCSAGNEGAKPWKYITAPADGPNVLTIGAVNSSEVRSSFSSQGPTSDGRIKPDVMAMGTGSVVTTETGELGFNNGTSFSSPTLAGLVACLWQALPDKTNQEIVQRIKQSADRYTNPDDFYGYGIPDFYSAISLTLATDSFTLNGFSLYPNPTTANLTISASGQKEASFVLYNNLGQEVIRKKLNDIQETTISMENLKTGFYLYTIVSGSATFSGKIIKK